MKRSSKVLPIVLGALAGMLAARVIMPAGTPAIRRRNRTPRSKTTATLEKVQIGGNEQWILTRSHNVNNPVLLFLHGGPGASELTLNRRNTEDLEQWFTVVNWDQRGAGKSHKAIKYVSKMNIEQFIEDTREVAQYLIRKLGKKRIILVGRSWGSALGMLTVARYPELFAAYVGIGQISNMEESEKASYQWTIDQARARGDERALQELEEMGPPPYSGDWLSKFMTQRKYVSKYGGEVYGNSHGGNGKIAGSVLFSSEYNVRDQIAYYSATHESLRLMHPQLMKVNLFTTVPEVQVPVFFIEGRHDRVVPSEISARYVDALKAPAKELIWFDESAHMPDIEEREKFQRILIEKVLPLAVNET